MIVKQTMVSCSVAAGLLVLSANAAAAGFALIEQSASGMGNAFAGGAAIADDASTVFFNPAGMSRMSGKQIVIAAHAITPSAKYTSAIGVPSGGDAGSTSIVPNAYFVMEVNPALKFGLGVNAPFGLQTEYDSNWVGKQQAIKSKIETVNVNPSLSYQVNDRLSLGGGLDYQHITGELSQDQGGAIGIAVINGSDNTWGYNLGVLYRVDANTRLGVAYRSTMSYTLNGTVTTSLPFANGPVSLNIKLPDTLSISGVHQYSDKWDVMADVTFTGWSSFKQVKIVDGTGATLSNTPENWKDTVRVAVGVTHHYNPQWLVRAGLAYDQAPVPNEFRTARIPDNNRTWLSFGGQYKPSMTSAIDVGYSHLFVSDSTINSPTPAPSLIGTYKNSVDILSVQYNYSF
ncbi:MAG: outer membrane protein transport protein [Rhodoferax sp.]|uniref:OmpP1/FadL family transporter n=1 Tax=Rhodoferax sp. TaxID=50421 RepID=UPI0030174CDE